MQPSKSQPLPLNQESDQIVRISLTNLQNGVNNSQKVLFILKNWRAKKHISSK